MQYFQNFSALYYKINGKDELVIDILKRALIKSEVISNIDAYLEYEVKEGDSLQSISYNLYDSVYPFWIILLMNQQLDPYFCLPVNENILKEQSKKKYGEDNLYNIHHYEDNNGNVVDNPIFHDKQENKFYRIINGNNVYINPDLMTDEEKNKSITYKEITNWQYEVNENEKRRKIKLLRPEYLDAVIDEFNGMVG